MAKLVKRDTFLYEDSGAGNFVRRQVFAGQHVPDHYLEGEDSAANATEDIDAPRGPGLGAGDAVYPHNRGVEVKEQLSRAGRGTSKEEVEAAEFGGEASARVQAKAEAKTPRKSTVKEAAKQDEEASKGK